MDKKTKKDEYKLRCSFAIGDLSEYAQINSEDNDKNMNIDDGLKKE